MDLQHLKGKGVSRIRRLYYVYQGIVDTREGVLELRFHDGSFLLLETNSAFVACGMQVIEVNGKGEVDEIWPICREYVCL